MLGAQVVQVCIEVMLHGFDIVTRIQRELTEFISWHGFSGTADFIGIRRTAVSGFGNLPTDAAYQPVCFRLVP